MNIDQATRDGAYDRLDFIKKQGRYKTMKNKTTHTPGPWETGSNGVSGKGLAICSGSSVVAVVYGNGYPAGIGSHPESTANARLIASAPELLSALKDARNVLAALVTGDIKQIRADSHTLREVRAAIAKAEGK